MNRCCAISAVDAVPRDVRAPLLPMLYARILKSASSERYRNLPLGETSASNGRVPAGNGEPEISLRAPFVAIAKTDTEPALRLGTKTNLPAGSTSIQVVPRAPLASVRNGEPGTVVNAPVEGSTLYALMVRPLMLLSGWELTTKANLAGPEAVPLPCQLRPGMLPQPMTVATNKRHANARRALADLLSIVF